MAAASLGVSFSVTPVDLAAAVIVLALVAYAVSGGADFGGGVWDALARGERRDAQRAAIARAMGPIWEANHVWLVFVVVLLFAVFPRAYYAASIGLFVPLHLVLVGVTLRGAAFAFRHHGAPRRHAWGTVFGASSVITPVLLGMCFGAASSGALRVTGDAVHADGPTPPWLTPLAVALGLGALSLFAYLAAVYMTVETTGALQDDFRRRALAAWLVVAAGAGATLPLVAATAPHLGAGLASPRGLPIVVAGTLAAVVSGAALLRRRFRVARVAAIAEVALIVVGWAVAEYPFVVYPDLTLATSGGSDVTTRFILATLPFGAAVLGPSLGYLLRVFKRG